MSQDSKENATISSLYSESVVKEAHPMDGDAGSMARDEVNALKEDIHNWVETDATEDELREIIDRIHQVESSGIDDLPPSPPEL